MLAALHPGTAARIMGFYRDDPTGRIAAISCRNMALQTAPETADDIAPEARKQTNRAGNLIQNRHRGVQRGIDCGFAKTRLYERGTHLVYALGW